MSKSLSVFKIKSSLGNLKSAKSIELKGDLPSQKVLMEFGIGDKIEQPTTILKFVEEKEGIRKYDVHHESNTMFDTIKVYKWDLLAEGETIQDEYGTSIITKRGYQVIKDFVIWVDTSKKLIYCFTSKYDAHLFFRRLNKNKVVDAEFHELDLSKINLVSEIIDEWGVWLDDLAEAVKKGLFGTKVSKLTYGKEEYITTYNVTYEHNDMQVDLYISKEGRLSCQSKSVTNKALRKIFDNIVKKIEEEEEKEMS